MFTSPAFTTNPTAPTQTGTDDSTKLATTEFVQARITDIIGNAGSTLDTLGELSASLAEDSGSLSTLTTVVGTKLVKASNLIDLNDPSQSRVNLGVDLVGTDNSTDVTLVGSYDYLTIADQAITLGQVDASADISNLTTSNVTEGTNLYYTDAKVKTKLNTETVVSSSAQITNGSSLVSSSIQVFSGGDISGSVDNLTVQKVQGVALTSAEATQLANIGSETISSTQWEYLGASDQNVKTNSDVTFNTITGSGIEIAQNNVTVPSGVDSNTSLLIKNNTWSGITMLSTEATGNFITFGDDVAGFAGRIQYGHALDKMTFETAASEVMNLTSAGVGITGNVTIHNSTNAPYIDFVQSGEITDSKARITMDQVDTDNGQLIFSTENTGTLTTALSINQTQDVRTYAKLGIRVDGDAIPWRGTAQIPAVINLAGNGALFTRPDNTFLSQNFYYNSSDAGAVIDAGQASIIQLTAGDIIFSGTTTGASGGATISIQERMKITAGGVVLGGNTVTGNKTSVSLNYYEEGTWTPTITNANGTLVVAGYDGTGSPAGQYNRVGRMVTLFLQFEITDLDGASSGAIVIGGIPFNCTLAGGVGGQGVIPTTGKTLNVARHNDNSLHSYQADGSFAGTGTHPTSFVIHYNV
jgi:hypothetical protein